jgi:opacity protein-like surface antigen
MKRLLLAGIGLAALTGLAGAADLPNPLLLPTKAPVAVPCTVTACSGPYIGGDVTAAGTDLAVLSGGLNTVITSTGASFGLIGGYQYWNGSLFAAVEVFVNYAQNPPQFEGLGVQSHLLTGELVKVGGNLGGLFGNGAAGTTPTQGPISFNIPGWTMISPFVVAGDVQRGHLNGVATGIGTEFIVGPGWNALVQYLHANYNGGQPAGPVPAASAKTEDLVMAGLIKKF